MAGNTSGYKGVRRRPFLLLGAACAVLGLVLGIIIGYFAIPKSATPWAAALTREGDPSVGTRLQRELKPDNIRENLRELTARPHIAGKEMDLQQAQQLRDRWLEYGLDTARLVPYDVLLAYPSRDPAKVSRVSLLDSGGAAVVESQLQEAGVDDPEAEPPFNAYSASGEVQGEVVYVNYARSEDFQTLVRDLGVDLTGKVCIARYGRIFRGDKVKLADQFGCTGLILYSDPQETRAAGMAVWPDGWMMPSTGLERGTVMITEGDPLTPFYPSNEYVHRLTEQEADLPRIPVHPISYGVAVEILRNMAGPEAPPDWQGGLDITYHLGPGHTGQASGRTVRLVVNQDRVVRTTYNVIGTIKGAVEPDRYVIMGNHRDAWVYGGVDPSSGTAVQLELARAMGKLKMEGWRPRRTIVFGSWGAEEYGLIGSVEFVEDYIRSLQERTVAYLNCDAAASGNFSLVVGASPLLHSLIQESSKKVTNIVLYYVISYSDDFLCTPVPDPHEPSKTLYDTWRMKEPEEEGNPDTRPRIYQLGSGSDYAPFFQYAGIAALDFWNGIDPDSGVSDYPLYHSAYETFELQDLYIDPEWTVHQAAGRMWGEMTVTLADALVLPMDVRDYATALRQMTDDLRQQHGTRLNAQNIDLGHLESAIGNFTKSATAFHQILARVDKSNPLAVRAVNDRLMKLERAFIDPLGLPDRPWFRHVAFAPSSVNAYTGQSFPGLADALFDIDNAADQAARWEVVRKQLAVTTFTVQSAADTLVNTLF